MTIAQARAHLVELQAAGVGYRQAAKLAGVSVQTVRHIRSGKPRNVKPETLAAILGVKAKLAPGALVNAYATRRLIRALKLEGFTEAAIARESVCVEAGSSGKVKVSRFAMRPRSRRCGNR
jgi:transcriptional regulator with XRE-family HTH domain